MSLSASYSPKLGMSGSYGSAGRLSGAELDNIGRKTYRLAANEKSPLVTKIPATTTNKSNEKNGLIEVNDVDDSDIDDDEATMNWTLFITILSVTIGSSLQFGYGTGVMNNSESFILEYFHDRDQEYSLVQWGTTVSCYGIGGLVGAVIGPKVIGKFMGRRATLLINNIFLVISSLLIAFAPVWWCQAIGRIFVGIVAGVSTAVVPTYFAEISPISIRGAVGTTHQLGITVGILLSQALSTPSLNLMGSKENWQWLFLVPVLCGLLEVIVLPFCPESPSYLYTTQGRGAARAALVRLQNEKVADKYLEYIREELFCSGSDEGTISVWELIANRTLRKQLIVGITIQLMMQFSGIDAVFYYSTTVFKQAEVADPELATTCLGIINVIVTIVAVKYMDSAGRKTLLQYSWIGMFLSFVTLTLSFVLKPYLNFADQVSVVATTGVIIFFAFGPGCVAWFFIAEIFPLQARDSAMALGITINWIANWLVAFSFPLLLEYTQPYTFLVFVSTTAFFLYFTLRFVPETKGRTVKQVTETFEELPLWVC